MMRDYIFSFRNKKVYALVEYKKELGVESYCKGKILECNFPDDLHELLDEYNELVDAMVLSLLDEVEERIYSYDLMLKRSGNRIFNLSIKEDGCVCFFLRYPTGDGFLDRYPSN